MCLPWRRGEGGRIQAPAAGDGAEDRRTSSGVTTVPNSDSSPRLLHGSITHAGSRLVPSSRAAPTSRAWRSVVFPALHSAAHPRVSSFPTDIKLAQSCFSVTSRGDYLNSRVCSWLIVAAFRGEYVTFQLPFASILFLFKATVLFYTCVC